MLNRSDHESSQTPWSDEALSEERTTSDVIEQLLRAQLQEWQEEAQALRTVTHPRVVCASPNNHTQVVDPARMP